MSRTGSLATLGSTAIATSPVATPGFVFFTSTITLPTVLPSGGSYWLSSSPTSLVAGLVDDAVIIRAGTTEIFRYDYASNGQPQSALVPVPASVLLPRAGQTLTIEFTDLYGSVYSATPLYLVWTP